MEIVDAISIFDIGDLRLKGDDFTPQTVNLFSCCLLFAASRSRRGHQLLGWRGKLHGLQYLVGCGREISVCEQCSGITTDAREQSDLRLDGPPKVNELPRRRCM